MNVAETFLHQWIITISSDKKFKSSQGNTNKGLVLWLNMDLIHDIIFLNEKQHQGSQYLLSSVVINSGISLDNKYCDPGVNKFVY